MTRRRHGTGTSDALPVSTLLARELDERTQPAMRPVDDPAPGQRQRLTFAADGTPVVHPYPVFAGDLPVPEPCTAITVPAARELLCGTDTDLLAPAVSMLGGYHSDDLVPDQPLPAPHAGERVGHHRAASGPEKAPALAAPSTALDDGPPTVQGGRDRCSPAPGAPVPHPDTSTGRTPDPAGRGESRGQRAHHTALAAAGPRRAS